MDPAEARNIRIIERRDDESNRREDGGKSDSNKQAEGDNWNNRAE